MKESPFYQEILAEGRAEGRAEARRESIRDVLTIRFGEAAAAECTPVLERIADGDRLMELLRLAIRCRRITEFRRALTTGG
jgi:predicted transposase YdaD